MPQAGQQEYKVIAPKEGRALNADAAAIGELKKAILAGIGFDCLIKDTTAEDGDISRLLALYPSGAAVAYYSFGSGNIEVIGLDYTINQYQGLAAVQEAEDEEIKLQTQLPMLTKGMDDVHLSDDNTEVFICIDGKYLTVTGSGTIEALTIAETGPAPGADFINITWEDAQKLIGLPLVYGLNP